MPGLTLTANMAWSAAVSQQVVDTMAEQSGLGTVDATATTACLLVHSELVFDS